MIAFVNGVMFASTDTGSKQNVSASISANTGIAFHCRIDVAVAHIVHGLTMTSSPGSIPIAPTAAMRPDVHELTLTACFTPKEDSQNRSNSCTFGPPKKSGVHAPRYFDSTPVSMTALAASTSSFPMGLYRRKEF